MSVLSLSWQESGVTVTNISQSLRHSWHGYGMTKLLKLLKLLLKPQMSSGICRWRCPHQGCICHESRAAAATVQPCLHSRGVVPVYSSRCRPTQSGRGTGSGPACYKLAKAGSYAAHSEMLRTEKGRRKGTESAQRDKPLGGFRCKAPSMY